jgi:hypothetical protein
MTRVRGGRFYQLVGGELVERPAGEWHSDPDVWICRRVADFHGHLPTGAATARCARCAAAIVYNPARQVTAPKVCLQCADITPGPLE